MRHTSLIGIGVVLMLSLCPAVQAEEATTTSTDDCAFVVNPNAFPPVYPRECTVAEGGATTTSP